MWGGWALLVRQTRRFPGRTRGPHRSDSAHPSQSVSQSVIPSVSGEEHARDGGGQRRAVLAEAAEVLLLFLGLTVVHPPRVRRGSHVGRLLEGVVAATMVLQKGPAGKLCHARLRPDSGPLSQSPPLLPY